jgi:peptidoglycan glycosyltransferase
MNKELRRVSIVVLLMFVALFSSSTVIQVFQQDSLKADGRNVRTIYASFSAERGPILVDGEPIAESVPVDDEYKYQRVYADGPMYSAVTGYFTLNQGNTGVEGALNDYLSGTANEQFLDQLNAVITGQNPKGAAVELTIDPACSRRRGMRWATSRARSSRSTRRPARSSPWSRSPPSTPTSSPSTTRARSSRRTTPCSPTPWIRSSTGRSRASSTSRFDLQARRRVRRPQHRQLHADSEFPNPPTLTLPESNSVITNAEGGSCGGTPTVTIATALRLSCNIPFAELGAELGFKTILGPGQEVRVQRPHVRGADGRHPERGSLPSRARRNSCCSRSARATTGDRRCRWRWSRPRSRTAGSS